MKRPDQDQFDLFSRHLEEIDPSLRAFAGDNGFHLEINPNRYPCRILRRTGNPELIIDIYQDDHWREVEYRTDLPHTIAAAAFYTPAEDALSLWKLSEVLLEHKPFSALREGLQGCLTRAAGLLATWDPEIIMERGQRLRNFKTECERNLL
jgi:hypothetical protein